MHKKILMFDIFFIHFSYLSYILIYIFLSLLQSSCQEQSCQKQNEPDPKLVNRQTLYHHHSNKMMAIQLMILQHIIMNKPMNISLLDQLLREEM